MARISTYLIVFLLFTTIAQAEPYTIVTTPQQEQALRHMVEFYNQRSPEAHTTATALLQQHADTQLGAFDKHRDRAQKAQLGERYKAATPEIQQQVDDLLREQLK